MKLTVKNYKAATKHIDFKKLPEAAQEAHKEFDSFADFYNEDKDIKEMLDNHFKIVEPYLKSSEKKSTTSKKAPAKKKATSSPKSNKKATPKNTATKKTAARKQAQRKPIEVDLMPLEYLP